MLFGRRYGDDTSMSKAKPRMKVNGEERADISISSCDFAARQLLTAPIETENRLPADERGITLRVSRELTRACEAPRGRHFSVEHGAEIGLLASRHEATPGLRPTGVGRAPRVSNSDGADLSALALSGQISP